MKAEVIQIPLEVYDNIVSHLKVHASTDGWAKACLEQLQSEAKPIHVLPSGSYLLDSTESRGEYRLN